MGEWQRVTEGSGWVRLTEQGPRMTIELEHRGQEQGLYKGWVLGGGQSYLIGTLLPSGEERLTLKRTLSIDQLRRAGCWPVTGFRVRLAVPVSQNHSPTGWTWMEEPGEIGQEPLLRQMLSRQGRTLCQTMPSGGVQLIYPFQSNQPCPLSGLFCFLSLVELEGTAYYQIFFDETGFPNV